MLQKRGMCSGTDEMMFAEELGVKHRRYTSSRELQFKLFFTFAHFLVDRQIEEEYFLYSISKYIFVCISDSF